LEERIKKIKRENHQYQNHSKKLFLGGTGIWTQGIKSWGHGYSTCLVSTNPWIQTPVQIQIALQFSNMRDSKDRVVNSISISLSSK
jgi:hypothetical protein